MEEIRKSKENIRIILEGNFSELDKANMIELLEEFPQKMKDALRLGQEFSHFLPNIPYFCPEIKKYCGIGNGRVCHRREFTIYLFG